MTARDPASSSTSGNDPSEVGVSSEMSTAVAEAPVASDAAVVGDPSAGPTALPHEPDGAPRPSQIIPGESGDDTFNRLILPEMEIMWRVALSLTRNSADAEDLVQESLLRAYRAIHTFDGRYPRAWVLTILRNTERNRHRRRRPELLADPDMAEERGPATDPEAVEQYAEDREFDEAVARSLLELPENFRQVIELIDVDGLSYQEAADLLDVPLGTIMSRLHRARRRIRDLLIPLGYGPLGHDHRADGTAPDQSQPNTENAYSQQDTQSQQTGPQTGSRVEEQS